MSEGLSSSKRRFIENWRQNVSVHMETGNICRLTISEMTPEPAVKASTEHAKTVADIANIMEGTGNTTLPAVKFSYNHAVQSDARSRQSRMSERFPDRKREFNGNRTVLPPSPNGCVIQNGIDHNLSSRNSSSVLKSVENNPRTSNLRAVDPNERKSSKTAREIYEKYNMKSTTNNYLMPNTIGSEFKQYKQPWRNKTFLSLPIRFTGSIQRSNTMFSRQKTFASDFSRDDISDVEDDGMNW